ncbi:MAG: ATP-binding protein [Bacteroidota bacterium]|nr:ATP-binding protein [Bacteroidota bacterium]
MSIVHFRTNALLKSIIGKDLITDDNIALLELVKNSFDAGSKKVDIVFCNILKNDDAEKSITPTRNSSKIIIKDEGIGMSEYDISEKWLNIAYSEKKEKREEFGRVLAGNKGVGRFSCDRLGHVLTIYTKKKGEKYNKLFIDWRVFEKEGQIDFNIQDVEFEIVNLSESEFISSTGYQKFESGTILEIAYLRDYWHSSKIISLKRQLERLINPNQAFKQSEFGVEIIASDFLQHDKEQEDYNKINGEVKNKIFEKLDFRTSSIQASIDDKGEYITTTLQDRGNEIFLLKERNTYSQLRGINISIYYLNPYAKMYFTKQTGIRSVDFGSIFLFINGFRIPPYGDIGDDWLGMEIRKGQGYNRFLGTREIVGRIEINDKVEQFKIISNRSGVVNNVAYDQLVKSSSPFGFYYKTFRRLERFVVEGIKWDSSLDDNSTIESHIEDKKWNETKERYSEDSLTRNKRILSVINNIIDAKKTDIIDLSVNDDFVKDIIGQQTERAKNELAEIIKVVADKSNELLPEQLTEVLKKINLNAKELDAFTKILSNYSDVDKKEIKGISTVHNSYEKLEETLVKEKEEKRILAEKLAIEIEKNTYLLASKRTLSDDAKGLIHNVKLTSKRSKQNAQNLYDALLEDRIKKSIALKWSSEIIYNSDKALKISNLITRANFKANSDYQDVNFIKFIDQYFELYNSMYEDNKLNFIVETKETDFMKRISILDLSLILDDLISNSVKAQAKTVKISMAKTNSKDLKILFSDDGIGLIKKFDSNPDVIFDLGVTTTDGSGIGLNYVRTTLLKMQGTIKYIGNNKLLKGATFEMIINKMYK